jgi:hypothetical protein
MRTAASSPATSATPRISLDIDAEQETRGFGAEAPKVAATDSCNALLIKSLLIILLQVWSVARKYAFNPPKIRFAVKYPETFSWYIPHRVKRNIEG